MRKVETTCPRSQCIRRIDAKMSANTTDIETTGKCASNQKPMWHSETTGKCKNKKNFQPRFVQLIVEKLFLPLRRFTSLWKCCAVNFAFENRVDAKARSFVIATRKNEPKKISSAKCVINLVTIERFIGRSLDAITMLSIDCGERNENTQIDANSIDRCGFKCSSSSTENENDFEPTKHKKKKKRMKKREDDCLHWSTIERHSIDPLNSVAQLIHDKWCLQNILIESKEWVSMHRRR